MGTVATAKPTRSAARIFCEAPGPPSRQRQDRARFGEDGFEKVVDRVARLERMVGVNDLDQFTPPR
jgi:hypothetical protein